MKSDYIPYWYPRNLGTKKTVGEILHEFCKQDNPAYFNSQAGCNVEKYTILQGNKDDWRAKAKEF